MNYFNVTNFHILSFRMIVRSLWHEFIWNYICTDESTEMIRS